MVLKARWTATTDKYYDYFIYGQGKYIITGIGGGTFRIKSDTDLYVSVSNGSERV